MPTETTPTYDQLVEELGDPCSPGPDRSYDAVVREAASAGATPVQ